MIAEVKGLKLLQPEGCAQRRSYPNRIIAPGRELFLAGQIGWDAAVSIPRVGGAVGSFEVLP